MPYFLHFWEVRHEDTVVTTAMNTLPYIEMHTICGRSSIEKSGRNVAYCSQIPCEIFPANLYQSPSVEISIGLQNLSLRDNVVFDSQQGYNETRYKAVVDACALRPDIEMLESGDDTGKLNQLMLC